VLDELRRIEILLRCQVLRFRMMDQDGTDELRGLYIKEEEIDALLTEGSFAGVPHVHYCPQLHPLLEACAALATTIATRKAASQRAGVPLRLERVQTLFHLSPFDVDTLLVCLAPELHRNYEKLYAYLQDDVTKKRPTVDLCLQLLCPSFEAALAARQRFTSSAPLVRHRLIHLWREPSQPEPSLLSLSLKADERLVAYLLGADDLDPRLGPYARHIQPRTRLDDVLLPPDVTRRLARLIQEQAPGEPGLLLYFQGPYGVGKQTTAEALCQALGHSLLVVDGVRLLQAEPVAFETTLQLARREALLQGAALYWDGFDALLADDKQTWLELLLQELAHQGGLTFLAGNIPWEPMDAVPDMPFVRLAFAPPSYAERVCLWTKALDDMGMHADLDLQALAGKFRLSGGQIQDAAATARNLARWRDPEHGQVRLDDLTAACRLHSNRKLATLAQPITPHYTWDDMVLPADRLQQLREICHYVSYRAVVYDAWGFDQKLALGKGLNVLFAGPSGTGKTMAAEIMAGALGLELYKIDLSTVVSKYIGDTEKNLARIFAEAETSNAILFFDEADALFGKRSEVRDAHDRYANIEIGYLLQKMEEYEGVVILATNLRKNMERRLCGACI